VSKIRCHGQRADENDSGEHRRNSRSGAWVRSFTWHRSRRRRVAPFHLGFTEAASWIPKLNLRLHFRADGCPPPREVPSSFDPFGLQIWITPSANGGSPVWGSHPFPKTDRSWRFVTLASCFDSDDGALPIRSRVLGATLKSRRDRRLRARRTTIWLPRACFGGGRVNVRGSVRAMAPPTRMSPFSESRPSRIPSSSWSTRHRGDRLPHAQTH
jgi:hypothetical protein